MLQNLSEENIAEVVAVEVEAGRVHWDEGGQGGVAPRAVDDHNMIIDDDDHR